ncbi:putative membrane protein, TIGR04086 family [Evansella caseinilytica]|uniref:Putative membrane protein, TIGR04086 family n=1 Tax=Evansella caseinilytica TaxID=1503961 RepID=A0A1H3K701_9BACI|nr:TIGR04086 family membrane protein [Evansella caseinilytica]SDY47388.1 putative membrane protein, TIGR04086 family [Evansella caseinilytica]
MQQRLFSSALYGILTILVLVIAASLISSVLLRFTSLQEGNFTWILFLFSFVAVFIGGFISGGRSGQKGWLAGAATSVLYTLIIFLVQFLGYNHGFDLQQWAIHGGYVIVAVIGGMIGVNIRGESF